MKKLSILFGLLLVFGLTVIAMADVDVTAEINKDKDKIVTETIDIDKKVDINLTVDVDVKRVSEAEGVLNQRNELNKVVGNEDDLVPDANFRNALIESSINSNTGIVGVNQDGGGNMNNQANVTSMSVVLSDSDGWWLNGFANSQASVEQINQDNIVDSREDLATGPQKTDTISGSIIDNHGIVGVNQTVGNMNNQANMVVIAVSEGAYVSLSEADLGQLNTRNWINERGITDCP